jgi:hypothetical protein
MSKFIEMKFKITNSGIINYIKLFRNEKDNFIPVWVKCGMNGNAVVWNNPNEKGNGTYHSAIIELSTETPTATGKSVYVDSAKILFSKDILSNTTGARGSYIENNGNFWAAEFLGSKILVIGAYLQVLRLAA